MPPDFLHNHADFADLIRIVADHSAITPVLVEKDYWIMHSLYGLQQMGLSFELKGGTSLSKGFGIIGRFSEDIDIRIEPPEAMNVKIGRNQDKSTHVASRKDFYDWLATSIVIDGIADIQRDTAFDDEKYRSGGVRLRYPTTTSTMSDLKEGILLEVGFDDVTPNIPKDISSWAYDFATSKVGIIDNRAKGVPCYHPGYTLVEKLQAISTKFRRQQEEATFPVNFMRHYYDVFCLLQVPTVQEFIGTDAYWNHKSKRFPAADNQIIAENEAFRLKDSETRQLYEAAYEKTLGLYYKGRPAFSEILEQIRLFAERL